MPNLIKQSLEIDTNLISISYKIIDPCCAGCRARRDCPEMRHSVSPFLFAARIYFANRGLLKTPAQKPAARMFQASL
jgi:hypothetical protein